MRNDFEHKEQVKLFQWIDRWKDEYPQLDCILAIPNGGHRSISVAKKLKAEGVRSGAPDIFVGGYSEPCGKAALFIEMKWGKNKLQPNQIEWRERLVTRGYVFQTCYSAKAAAQAIVVYFDLPQRLVDSYLGFLE